jgi:hypothetical protein
MTGAKSALEQEKAHYEKRINIAERLRTSATGMIRNIMEASGLDKLSVPEGKVSISKGSNSLHLEVDFAPPQGYELPSEVRPDKAAIKSFLEGGGEMLGATLVTGSKSVRVV